jgi:hypothetical protein
MVKVILRLSTDPYQFCQSIGDLQIAAPLARKIAVPAIEGHCTVGGAASRSRTSSNLGPARPADRRAGLACTPAGALLRFCEAGPLTWRASSLYSYAV